MLKTYRYRIYPNEEQCTKLAHTFGCVRYVYNWGLSIKTGSYAQGKKLNCFDTINELKKIKDKKENSWLKDVPAQPLQMALRNLDNAYTGFFKKVSRFPKYKKKQNKQSFQYPQGVRVNFTNSQVYLPKIGDIEGVFHRTFEGEIKTCTVCKTPADSYYVCILVEDGKEKPEKNNNFKEDQVVGIDLGIKTYAVLSNGTEIANPRHLKNKQKRLAVKQKQLSRKEKGSNNRNKARLEVAKVHEQVCNSRKDFQHKLSTTLISSHEAICLEDLNIVGMVKNRKLAKHISDCAWGQFNSFLEYKADWCGKNIIRLGRFQPTSQPCYACGTLNKAVKNLSIREWTCPACGVHNLRDITAAKNIKAFGLVQVGFKELEPTINKSVLSGEHIARAMKNGR